MNYTSYEDLESIIDSETFINSKPYCKCITTLSDRLNNYASKQLKENNINIPKKHYIILQNLIVLILI